MSLRSDLIKQEGWKNFPYKDSSKGIWTIGVGHNMEEDPMMMMAFTKLQVKGLTNSEIGSLLTEDIAKHENDLLVAFYWYTGLTDGRKEAMMNLSFNMGIRRLHKFIHFLKFMEEGKYEEAAQELLYTEGRKTPYYNQVGSRAEKVAAQIKGEVLSA